MKIHKFTFGPFGENTYLLEDEISKNCIIIDPGMYDSNERKVFKEELIKNKLSPKLLLNTHCHIDHVMGNKFIHDEFGLVPQIHEKAAQTMEMSILAAKMYGLNYDESPEGEKTLKHEEYIEFEHHRLDIYFTPGHAPGHVVFHNAAENYLIGGDVLFQGSVGRVDLPGSVASDLVKSIQNIIYKLPDHTIVYPGHGAETSVGHEKIHNAFIRENDSSLG